MLIGSRVLLGCSIPTPGCVALLRQALARDFTPSTLGTSCPSQAQAYEPEVPVKVREWISSALASPDLVG